MLSQQYYKKWITEIPPCLSLIPSASSSELKKKKSYSILFLETLPHCISNAPLLIMSAQFREEEISAQKSGSYCSPWEFCHWLQWEQEWAHWWISYSLFSIFLQIFPLLLMDGYLISLAFLHRLSFELYFCFYSKRDFMHCPLPSSSSINCSSKANDLHEDDVIGT